MTQTLTQSVSIAFDRPVYRPHKSLLDRAFCLYYWNETDLDKENLLQKVMDIFLSYKYFIAVDQGWNDWDLEIYWGIWSKVQIKVCTENHGGSKRLLRVRCALRMSQFATMAMLWYSLFTFVAIILGMTEVAAVTVVVGALNAVVILYQNFRFGQTLYHVLEIVAKKLHLLPIHTTSTTSAASCAILQQ